MLKKIYKLYIIALPIIIYLYSCSNLVDEPNKLPYGSQNESVSLNMYFDFEIDNDNSMLSETRSIPFLPSENQNGYLHPSISIKNVEDTPPIYLYIYNKNVPLGQKAGSKSGPKSDAIKVKWNYKIENGKIKINLSKDEVNTTIAKYQLEKKGWKMRAVLGGEVNKSKDIVEFGNLTKNITETEIPIIRNGQYTNLDVIYISDPIDIEYKKVNKKHSIRPINDEQNSILKLKNQCLVLFYSIKENRLNKETNINGIKLAANNLSFSGTFDLKTGRYTSKDTKTNNYNVEVFKFSNKADLHLDYPMTSRTPYVAIVAVPKKGASTTNLSLTSLITESLIPTKTIEFQNKAIAPNTYYSLGDNLYVENE